MKKFVFWFSAIILAVFFIMLISFLCTTPGGLIVLFMIVLMILSGRYELEDFIRKLFFKKDE